MKARDEQNQIESGIQNDIQMEQADDDIGEPFVEEESASTKAYPSHFRNKRVHVVWRYGILIFLLGTFALLLAADISSGVTAKTLYVVNGAIFSEEDIATISIFTSVRKIWESGSYFLAGFICVTSVSWPYVKLLLSMAAWIVPIKDAARRERFLEVIDVLDKWSFVDIFVITIIMVSFRSTLEIVAGSVYVEVVVIPKWGYYAFIAANMLSLWATQAILYHHRRVQYHSEAPREEAQNQVKTMLAKQTTTYIPLLVPILGACIFMHLIVCAINIFEYGTTSGDKTEIEVFSIISIGQKIPHSTMDPNAFGIRFLQCMFLIFSVALPVWSNILFGVLYLVPMTPSVREKMFLLSEITFSWSSIEVFTISAIFAVIELPKFGNSLDDCDTCYTTHSKILWGRFAALCISTFLNTGLSLMLLLRAHKAIYAHARR